MQTFWLITILSLLTCAPSSPLSYASAVRLSRRQLYGDEESALPPPLSPTSPPFFPLYSFSAPPPPPPPSTFAVFPTFPANISALVLPRSPKSHQASPTLLVPVLSAVFAVAIGLGLALFLYARWRRQNHHFKDFRSSTSSHDDERSHVTTNFNVAATTSPSQVFYLGAEESDHISTEGTFFLKSESPEIQPLPPLPPRSFQPSYEAEEAEEEEEEEDEFYSPVYSPVASLPGSETSSPSHSCSGWVSPERSFTVTVSPPNPRYSDASFDQNLQSPSPERLLRVRNRGSSSLRMFSFWNKNMGFGFPRISSASTSPDRGFIRTPLSSLYSSVSNSPDGFFRKFLDSSPPIWNDFSRNVKSVLLSSHSVSSRRDFVINIGESSRQIAPPPPPTRPPPLVPPSQPFVVQNDVKKLSFSELPPKQVHWDGLKSSSFK